MCAVARITRSLMVALAALAAAHGTSALAQNNTWNQTAAGTYTWNSASNWLNTGSFPTGADTAASLNVNLSGSQTINLEQTITLGTLTIGDSTSSFFGTNVAAGSAGSLVFDVTSGSAVLVKPNLANGVQDQISANIVLNDMLRISNTANNNSGGVLTLNLSGTISEGVAGSGIHSNGAGPTWISGTSNTFTGQVTVTNGYLAYNTLNNAGSAGSLGTSGTINLGGNANSVTLRHTGSAADVNNRMFNLISTGGTVTIGNAQNNIWEGIPGSTGANTFNGDFINSTGTTMLIFQGPTTINGKITESGAGRTNVWFSFGNTVNSIDSTYTGQTTLGDVGGAGVRVMKLANAGQPSSFGAATGTSAVIVHRSSQPLTYGGTDASITDRPVQLTTGTFNTNTWKFVSGSTGSLTFTADFISAFTGASGLINVNQDNSSTAGLITFAGKLVNSATGALSLTVLGNSRTAITGLNTFTGSTTMSQGAILEVNTIRNLGESSALGAPATVAAGRLLFQRFNGSPTLRYTGTGDATNRELLLDNAGSQPQFPLNATLDMAGSGTLRFTSTVSSTTALAANPILTLTGSTAGVGEIAGSILNATGTTAYTLSLAKTGTGTWILSGNNTYTGTTGITAGKLFINGDQSGATGAVSVAAAAWLGGSGTIGGATTFSGAAFLQPGSSGTDTGVLAFGSNLTLSTTGTTLIDITGTTRGSLYDGVDVTGALGYNGRLQFNLPALVTGTFDVFSFTSGSESGNFASVAGSIGATPLSFTNASGVWTGTFAAGTATGTATFTQATGDLVIVPEPQAMALAAIGAGLAAYALRRRTRG